ncbi:hypothetical protein [Rhizobium sp. BK538]|uniref:hypothetical protein n=1 Tax=Rhizobium sp. BK538 TaxID=2586984 RepID=UPI001612D676|nr:hypothetical protein [Rhizobium sp. BK538]MBB4170793.1 hypothetical protein [Rhizobium sp. BK538]
MHFVTAMSKWVGRKAVQARWTIASIVLIVVSLLLFGFGFFTKTPSNVATGSSQWFGNLAWELGKLGLSGGVVATLLRMLNSISFFEEVWKFAWSDSYLAKRNDIEDLWERLTAFRYLRFSNLHETEQREFLERLKGAIRQGMGHEENQFVRGMQRNIDIRWADEARGVVEVTERSTYEVVPRTNEPLTINTRVHVHGKLGINEYTVSKDEIRLLSDNSRAIPLTSQTGPDHIETRYELSGAKSYRLQRERISSWKLDNDPVLTVTSRHVCDGHNLEVNCVSPNILTRFRENGINKIFIDDMSPSQRQNRPGDQRQLSSGILLPGNGFSIFIERIP